MSNLKNNTASLEALIEQANALPTEKKVQASKSVTPSESAQTVNPDSGYDGIASVSVGAISSTYVGSGVTKQAAKTITPSTSSQTAVASGVYTTGAVTVGAIPDEYQDVSGVTLPAEYALEGYTYVDADGNEVAGTMETISSPSFGPSATYPSYTIPEGYSDGTSVVRAMYDTSKTVTPTKDTQVVTGSREMTDKGVEYNFMAQVTVNPIPDEYQDVSGVTATAGRVVSGDVFVDADGVEQTGTLNVTTIHINASDDDDYELPTELLTLVMLGGQLYADGTDLGAATTDKVLAGETFTSYNSGSLAATGTMTNNGAVTETLDTTTASYIVPEGYHNGSGKVSISTETKSATPTEAAQTITPTSGKVLSEVTVAAIPSTYVKPTATQAATTYTPGTSDQTIAAGTYCSGVQTIQGDANLLPENIAGGVSIFGVTGTLPVSSLPTFTYTGSYETVDEGDDNWKIRFLTSGTLTLESGATVDIFAVGGGGGGSAGNSSAPYAGGGGGGGYTATIKGVSLIKDTEYVVTIGAGGSGAGGASSFANNVTANGGGASSGWRGGSGGSGGGSGTYNSYSSAGAGGSNGGNGLGTSDYVGEGQVTTTREFGEEDGTLYAGGGGGGSASASSRAGGSGGGGKGGGANNSSSGIAPTSGTANTGGGGGGGYTASAAGGSGIVIIRNAR